MDMPLIDLTFEKGLLQNRIVKPDIGNQTDITIPIRYDTFILQQPLQSMMKHVIWLIININISNHGSNFYFLDNSVIL